MDAITYLRQEHSGFRKTLKEIGNISDEKKKEKRFHAFCEDLLHHEKMEQKIWYPALRKDLELGKVIKHLLAEEKSAAQAIKKFKQTGLGFMWQLRFYKFRYDVNHHAKEEEQELFPKVRRKVSKAALLALGVKMRKFKKTLE